MQLRTIAKATTSTTTYRALSSTTRSFARSQTPSPSSSPSSTRTRSATSKVWQPPRQTHKGRSKDRKRIIPPVLSGGRLRSEMIFHLSHRRPREALQLFLRQVDHPATSHTPTTLEGLIWIFFLYRHPLVALEAVAAIHSRGYLISTRLAAKVLNSCQNELLWRSDSLVSVLGWIKEGIARETKEGKKELDVKMIETVMDTLKKMGRIDWNSQVFEAYRGSLREGELGNSRLWAGAIAAQAAGGNVMAAQLLFKEWRTGWLERLQVEESETASPPRHPYLALLNHFAVNSPPLPTNRDPAYLLLEVIKHDKLPLSTEYLNALLRTELARKRYSSFWGLWSLFDHDQAVRLEVRRDPSTWKLASRAKLLSGVERRQRGRIHQSPVIDLAPIRYQELHPPSSRALFAQLLSTRQELTSHRPALHLSSKTLDPLSPSPSLTSSVDSSSPAPSSPSTLLNMFLNLFLSYQDFPAAVVVLETFSVHRIEPTAKTHANVIVSVVKLWEKGKLADTNRDRGTGGGGERMSDTSEFEGAFGTFGGSLRDELTRERRTAQLVKNWRGGPRDASAIEVIREIIEGRKMRVGLWEQSKGLIGESDTVTMTTKEPISDEDEGGESEVEEPNEPVPNWMLSRELRDTKYLVELLERCSGLDKGEWNEEMVQTRKELLPKPKHQRSHFVRAEEGDELDSEKKKKRITKGARYRHRAYGVDLK